MLKKLRAWWNKDATTVADEEPAMTEHERDLAEEDYEERKDDISIAGSYEAGGMTDYEADSEKPRP